MWIQCTVEREDPFPITTADGTTYGFQRRNHRQVAWVASKEHQQQLLALQWFIEAEGIEDDPSAQVEADRLANTQTFRPRVVKPADPQTRVVADMTEIDQIRAEAERNGLKLPRTVQKLETAKRLLAEHLAMQEADDIEELTQ